MRWSKTSSIDSDVIHFGEEIKNTIFEMRKYKSERNLSMRSEIDVLTIRANNRYMEWFKLTEKDLLACSRAKSIEYRSIDQKSIDH